MHQTRRLIVAGAAVLASLAAAGPAAAHQSPAGCNTSAAHVDLTGGINVVHRNGDDVAIVAKVSNNAAAHATSATRRSRSRTRSPTAAQARTSRSSPPAST